MTMRKPLVWSMCAGALLFACKGDDDGSDDAAGTSSGSGSESGTNPTSNPTEDPTSDPTEDPTVDPDTSAGPTDTTDDPTDPTVDPDTSTGVNPGDAVSFRFNSIAIHDPHFFAPVIGTDVTESNVNMPLNAALNSDGDDDTPADGNLDLGLVVRFNPLDQSDGGGAEFQFANAQCTAPVETTTCDLFPKTELYTTTYTNSVAGPCLPPNAAELSDYGNTPPAPPEATPGPCFESDAAAVVLQTMTFSLPLGDARVSATYVGDPAGNLVTGNIQGFLSTADAEATIVNVPVFGDTPIADLLREEDMDGDGWRMHVSFTAEVVDWTGS